MNHGVQKFTSFPEGVDGAHLRTGIGLFLCKDPLPTEDQKAIIDPNNLHLVLESRLRYS